MFRHVDNMGLQDINETSTTQNHPLGTVSRAYDDAYLATAKAMSAYTTCTISGTAPAMTLTDTAGSFSKELVGSYLILAGTHTTAANAGIFLITGVPTSTSLTYTHAGATAEAFGSGGTYRIPVSMRFGEFVYAKGVASTVAGDACILYADGTTQRAVHTTYAIGRLGIAASPNTASRYGWYQVYGLAPCSQSAGAIGTADSAVYLTSTAGVLDDTAVKGEQVMGANWSGQVRTEIVLSYPWAGVVDAQS